MNSILLWPLVPMLLQCVTVGFAVFVGLSVWCMGPAEGGMIANNGSTTHAKSAAIDHLTGLIACNLTVSQSTDTPLTHPRGCLSVCPSQSQSSTRIAVFFVTHWHQQASIPEWDKQPE